MTGDEGRPSHPYGELHSSADSSGAPSRPGSSGTAEGDYTEPIHVRRGRVRFNSTSESNDAANKRSSNPLRDISASPSIIAIPKNIRMSPLHSRNNSATNLLRRTPDSEKENPFLDPVPLSPVPVLKPRPKILRTTSEESYEAEFGDIDGDHEKAFSALAAQERAQRIASLVGSHSAPTSTRTSLDEDESPYADDRLLQSHKSGKKAKVYPVNIDDIPLADMDSKRTYDGVGDDLDMGSVKPKASTSTEAHKLVRAHTRRLSHKGLALSPATSLSSGLVSGQVTPVEEQGFDGYVPKPTQYVYSNISHRTR